MSAICEQSPAIIKQQIKTAFSSHLDNLVQRFAPPQHTHTFLNLKVKHLPTARKRMPHGKLPQLCPTPLM